MLADSLISVIARSTIKAMTAEERNRTLKYGPAVPRSWIPDFNATHQGQGAKPVDTPELLSELERALQRQRRAIRQGRAKPVRLKALHSDQCRWLAALGGVLLAGAAGVNIAFHASSSPVDLRREPFALLPTSALLALAGGTSLVAAALVRRRTR
ncbi:MAG: hypothetical protein FJ077_14450 [Cyanobacteria bacterium K_DeepCast_35m_m2_023]|nr:hypothetical protein [Cyanobacteria bacterium K_DeepCast_35m_m2_023]